MKPLDPRRLNLYERRAFASYGIDPRSLKSPSGVRAVFKKVSPAVDRLAWRVAQRHWERGRVYTTKSFLSELRWRNLDATQRMWQAAAFGGAGLFAAYWMLKSLVKR